MRFGVTGRGGRQETHLRLLLLLLLLLRVFVGDCLLELMHSTRG